MIPIANWEQRYALTTNGQIINLANNQPMKLRVNPNGYLIVTLATGKNNQGKQLSVHRLMALHFLPNPYSHPQVNHKDGVKINNTVDINDLSGFGTNLEWCTAEQNINHAFKIGLRLGYMSANAKDILIQRVLTGEQIKNLAIECHRGQESLAGMLRNRAKKTGLSVIWKDTIRRARSERTSIRNKK